MVNQISPERLAEMIDSDESFTLVDTRPKDSYEGWRIHGAENVPFDPDEELSDEKLEQLEAVLDEDSIVAICGKGLTSTPFSFELEQQGYEDISVVKGGMEDWSKVYEVVPVETETDLVVLQLQRRAKGCLGYVVGLKDTGSAVVVDPTRQTDQFKIAAEEAGLTIERVLDTHVHADHISGGRKLADELEVPYHLGEHATDRDVEYEFEALADGETIELGDLEIETLHAPGHTTEMVNYLVDGEVLLTGDTLFVESVGRTELQFGDEDASKGAEILYETLHETILELPDETHICPGHVSVTEDNQYKVGTPGESIGEQLGTLREELALLGLDAVEFVNRLVDEAPDKPPNYERVIEINTGSDPVDDESEATELELGPNNCAA